MCSFASVLRPPWQPLVELRSGCSAMPPSGREYCLSCEDLGHGKPGSRRIATGGPRANIQTDVHNMTQMTSDWCVQVCLEDDEAG